MKQKRKLSDEVIDTVIADFHSSKSTMTELARLHNVDPHTIKKYLGITSVKPYKRNPVCPCGEPSVIKSMCNTCYVRQLTDKNKERYAALRRAQFEAAPEKVRAKRCSNKHTRRARLNGRYTVAQWEALLELFNHTCPCCGEAGEKLTVDHIVPISKGGSNTIDNIQPLCLTCNIKKGAKVVSYLPHARCEK